MKSNFEERKQARIERYEELSEKAEERSQELWDEGRQMASAIPFGQPILVGHHSKKRKLKPQANRRSTISQSVITSKTTGFKFSFQIAQAKRHERF